MTQRTQFGISYHIAHVEKMRTAYRSLNLVRRGTAPSLIAPSVGAVRRLNVHEYVSMDVMRKFNIPVPSGGMAETAEDAVKLYKSQFGRMI